MNQSFIRLLTICISLAGLAIAAGALHSNNPSTSSLVQDDDHPRAQKGQAFDVPRPQVEQGAEDAAIEYYKTIISPHVGFKTPDTILESTVSSC